MLIFVQVTVELQIDAGAKEMITKTKRVGKLCYQIVGGPLAPADLEREWLSVLLVGALRAGSDSGG